MNVEKAINLLGMGIPGVQVAAALGVSESLVSQLATTEENAARIAELKVKNLSSNTLRDSKLDALEDKLIEKLENSLSMVYKPGDILRMFQVINTAKRRGINSHEIPSQPTNVVKITIPTVIQQKIVTNIHNQVVQAGSQELVTMQSKTLMDRYEREQDNVQTAEPTLIQAREVG